MTLRVSCELIAEYRDWSWEAKCQLGELVERAPLTFLNAQFATVHRDQTAQTCGNPSVPRMSQK